MMAIFLLFEYSSIFSTSRSPLKAYEMWLLFIHILFVCFFSSSSPLVWSLFFLSKFYDELDLGKWIDGFIRGRGMDLGLFLGNALIDIHAESECIQEDLGHSPRYVLFIN